MRVGGRGILGHSRVKDKLIITNTMQAQNPQLSPQKFIFLLVLSTAISRGLKLEVTGYFSSGDGVKSSDSIGLRGRGGIV